MKYILWMKPSYHFDGTEDRMQQLVADNAADALFEAQTEYLDGEYFNLNEYSEAYILLVDVDMTPVLFGVKKKIEDEERQYQLRKKRAEYERLKKELEE